MIHNLRYWDSVCFLAVMKKEPKSNECRGVIQAAETGSIKIVTSTWTLTEVIKITGQTPMTDAYDARISSFFEQDYIVLRDVTEEIGHLARRLVWDQGYSTKDAVHVATALIAKCPVLDTFDKKLIRKGAPSSSKMLITKPNLPYKASLPLKE